MGKSIANQPSPSQVSGRLATWHRVMEEAGLTYEDLQAPINDAALRRELVRFWQLRNRTDLVIDEGFVHRLLTRLFDEARTVVARTESLHRAREIMGANFHGPDQVAEHFRVRFTEPELEKLRFMPFTTATLESCKDTHVLVAGYPLSILEVKKRAKPHFWNQDWYNGEAFAKKTKPELRWYLVRKQAVKDSFSKTWTEQLTLLPEGEIVPKACVMVYTIILHFLTTGERLFEKDYVRCEDVDSAASMRTVCASTTAAGMAAATTTSVWPLPGCKRTAARTVHSIPTKLCVLVGIFHNLFAKRVKGFSGKNPEADVDLSPARDNVQWLDSTAPPCYPSPLLFPVDRCKGGAACCDIFSPRFSAAVRHLAPYRRTPRRSPGFSRWPTPSRERSVRTRTSRCDGARSTT